ncbi:MAG: hypothetical protein QXZ59_06720 [Nitrososphaeria archaeon]
MVGTDNLNKIYEEIVLFIRSVGIKIFPAVYMGDEWPDAIIWDTERGDWKSFIEISKEEGVKTIIVSTVKGNNESHANDIGAIILAWFKDWRMYVFKKYAKWYSELISKETEVTTYRGVSRTLTQASKEALEELQTKSENELAEEALAFFEKSIPTTGYHGLELFWENKGINKWMLEPKLRFKVEKVEALVEQKRIEKEKELLPKLVEECLKWAQDNGLSRITKSNIDYFLIEKNIELTRTSRDVLYNKVNFILQRK